MKAIFIIPGIITGIVIALILNKLLADKVENKGHRIGLKVPTYIVCILLSLGFVSIFSLRTTLDNFIEGRIETLNVSLTETFPGMNIMEIAIDTNNIVSVSNDLQQAINGIDTSGDSFFEKLIYSTFVKKLTDYMNPVKKGVDTIATMTDDNGIVTINSILYNLKDMTLNTVSPYFKFVQIGIIVILLVYIGIYTGIVIFLKKGGAMYNKSIVFGNIEYNDSTERRQNRE